MTRIGIIGFGKIARDQHVPSIAATPGLELAAVASRHGGEATGVSSFPDYHAMLAAGGIDAVAVCTGTQDHYAITRDCLAAGVDVLLEKPPTTTVSAFDDLIALAAERRCILFAAWHSRFAAGVEAARAALAGQTVTALDIVWHEDVRRWHPGQQWIWEPGGFGVFDPGINALSIATAILPAPLVLDTARLDFPANRAGPIAADLVFASGGRASFDWRIAGEQIWSITVQAGGRRVALTEGGQRLAVDGATVEVGPHDEYRGVYRRFAALLDGRQSDTDATPLQLVADAFLVGERRNVDAFVD